MKKTVVLTNKTTINKINKKIQYRDIINVWDLPFKKERLHSIISHNTQKEIIDVINNTDCDIIGNIDDGELIYYECHEEEDMEDETYNLQLDNIIGSVEINNKKSIPKSRIYNIVLKEIKNKICGYGQQDKNKKIYTSDLIISLRDTVELLANSCLICSYCRKIVYILYTEYRDPNQWTLDRIDNNIGHHKNNCVISCLSCNLQKRRMNDDNFRFTKQMKIIKKG